MKAFYQNPTTLKWELTDTQDGLVQLTAGTCRLKTNAERTEVWIYQGVERVGNAMITDIAKNAEGDKYADWEEFDGATADFFTTSDLDAKLDALIAAVQNGGGTMLKAFSVEITRPANTTVYSAGDVVADVSAAFVKLADVAKTIGAGVKIIRVRIQTEDTGVASKKFNLHMYKDAPTFIADNAAFAVSYANASKRIGAIPVVMGTGNLATVGMNDYNQCIVNPTARDVYWILETVDGFTPSANSTKFQITIDCELSN